MPPRNPPLRVQAIDILNLHLKGSHEVALEFAVRLAKTPEGNRCALVLNLAGDLSLQARERHMISDPEIAWKFLSEAVGYFRLAVATAPNCVQTAAACASALLDLHASEEASGVLNRVKSHPNPDDPLVHHARYALVQNMGRDQRIQAAQDKYQTALRESDRRASTSADAAIKKIISILDRPKALSSIFAAAEDISRRYPQYARAQYLLSYTAIELMRSSVWDDEKRKTMLKLALSHMTMAALKFDRSLPIAAFHVKLLISSGQYESAENECRRALQIESPEDPHCDDLPIESTPGDQASERISTLKLQIKQLLPAVFSAAKYHFSCLTKETTNTLLSVSVENLEKYNREAHNICSISKALQDVSKQNSWALWICPYFGAEGCSYCDAKADKILHHLLSNHAFAVGLSRENSLIVDTRLTKTLKMSRGYEALEGISFCKKTEVIRFHNMDKLFSSFSLLYSGESAKSVDELKLKMCADGNAAFQSFEQQLLLIANISEPEVQDALDLLESLWGEFLLAFLFDFRKALLPLLASRQWIEVKKCLEKDPKSVHGGPDKRVIGAVFFDLPGIFPSISNLVLESSNGLEASIIVIEDPSGIKRGPAEPAQPPRYYQLLDEEASYDPYKDMDLHHAYMRELSHNAGHVCSHCFFVLKRILPVAQAIHHYSKHGFATIKCELCTAQFRDAIGMDNHKSYCHREIT